MEAQVEHWIGGARRPSGKAGTSEHPTPWHPGAETLRLPCATVADWNEAIDAAERSSRALAFAPPSIQHAPQLRLAQALNERAGEFAAALEIDLGWNAHDVRSEVHAALDAFWQALEGGTSGLMSSRPLGGKRGGILVVRPPHDAPLQSILRLLGAALRAGNATLISGATTTPRSLVPLIDALESSALYPGAVQVLFGRASTIEEVLAQHAAYLHWETWTHWTPVDAASPLAPTLFAAACLEQRLGEDRPITAAIIGPDADLESSAQRIAEQLFDRAGAGFEQPRAIFVHEDVAADLCDALVAELRRCASCGTARSPLVEEGAVRRAEAFVRRALEEGVTIPQGGQADGSNRRGGAVWFEPTVLVNVAPDSLTARARVRAPIALLNRYETMPGLLGHLEQCAIQRAWTSPDLSMTWRERGIWHEGSTQLGSLAPPRLQAGEGLFSAHETNAFIA